MTVIVVMGVTASGKTTIGTALSSRLAVPYAEADSFHPKENIEKMSSGSALTDEDRAPWLRAIADWISTHSEHGGVVSSSALKRRYRDTLRTRCNVWFLHLYSDRALLAKRMTQRSGHFMPLSLLDSQLAELEPLQPDEQGTTVDIADGVEQVVDTALHALRRGMP